MTLRLRRVAAAALLTIAAGCGGDGRVPTVPVQGTVTLDDKPLAAGTIVFESPGKRPATGKIVDGKITDVMTYEPGDGAPVGSHAVAIQAREEAASAVTASPGDRAPGGMNYMVGKSLLPERYTQPAKSGLTADIKQGGPPLSFPLKSKAP